MKLFSNLYLAKFSDTSIIVTKSLFPFIFPCYNVRSTYRQNPAYKNVRICDVSMQVHHSLSDYY